MDLSVYIQLICLCVVNIIFSFSGIVLNTLVIISFWKSSQLRKKLCHFMIMMLSCFDLVAVVTTYPTLLLYLISWLREDYDLLSKMTIYMGSTSVFIAFSCLALLVMSIERFLGAYYPIFHRTSVTRRRLLTLLAILVTTTAVKCLMSINGLVIPFPVTITIFLGLFLPPFMFVNFKLFTIVRKLHRERAASPEKRTTKNLKTVSTALWVVACLVLLSIPATFYIAFNIAEKSTYTLRLSYICTLTCSSMNCTFNNLIFFWKNEVLRTEEINVFKTLRDLLVGS